jgi:hypothetical protein
MCDTEARAPKSFLEARREAALAELRERAAEHRKVADIVIGTDHHTRRGRSVGEIVKLGSDYVVEVQGDTPRGAPWTVVESSKATSWYFHTQEEAVLYLLALRHNRDHTAVYYAGLILNLPRTDED